MISVDRAAEIPYFKCLATVMQAYRERMTLEVRSHHLAPNISKGLSRKVSHCRPEGH